MSDLAAEILEQMREQAGDDRPCIAPSHMSKRAAKEPLSYRALSRALRNNHDKDGKLFGLPAFTPHDLRRSAATQMTLLGIPRLHVAKGAGARRRLDHQRLRPLELFSREARRPAALGRSAARHRRRQGPQGRADREGAARVTAYRERLAAVAML